ncbi:MAG: glycosyltransferase [Cloacibacillus sp.]
MMIETKFSVLMSLYIKEKPEYVRACFESLLRQTVPADEWVVVEDGPLTNELYLLLEEYNNKYPNLIKRVPLTQNRGLGLALREGIIQCSNELIARMDTDDVARNDRFEKQLNEFVKNPSLDICGSHISEFYDTPEKIIARRIVPLVDKEIKKYERRRDAFNHMSVMYKKSTVLKAGNYQHAMLMEDSLLWINMILAGATCCNIDDSLVFVRTGKDMYERRGGLGYFRKYRSGKKRILETGYISQLDYLCTIWLQFIIATMPNSLREWVYKRFLRS